MPGTAVSNSEDVRGKFHRGREISSTKWGLEVRVTPGEEGRRMGEARVLFGEHIHSHQREFHKEKNGGQENKRHFPGIASSLEGLEHKVHWRAVISTAVTIGWWHIMEGFEC